MAGSVTRCAASCGVIPGSCRLSCSASTAAMTCSRTTGCMRSIPTRASTTSRATTASPCMTSCPTTGNATTPTDTTTRTAQRRATAGTAGGKGTTELRQRQAKNFCCLLLLANGTPMLRAGDEFLQTQGGNNNPYNQDNGTTWLDW